VSRFGFPSRYRDSSQLPYNFPTLKTITSTPFLKNVLPPWACFQDSHFFIQLSFHLKEKSTARFLGIKLWPWVALSGFIPKNEHPSEPLQLIGAVSFQSAEGGTVPALCVG
jgi:hypothetical protein